MIAQAIIEDTAEWLRRRYEIASIDSNANQSYAGGVRLSFERLTVTWVLMVHERTATLLATACDTQAANWHDACEPITLDLSHPRLIELIREIMIRQVCRECRRIEYELKKNGQDVGEIKQLIDLAVEVVKNGTGD